MWRDDDAGAARVQASVGRTHVQVVIRQHLFVFCCGRHGITVLPPALHLVIAPVWQTINTTAA